MSGADVAASMVGGAGGASGGDAGGDVVDGGADFGEGAAVKSELEPGDRAIAALGAVSYEVEIVQYAAAAGGIEVDHVLVGVQGVNVEGASCADVIARVQAAQAAGDGSVRIMFQEPRTVLRQAQEWRSEYFRKQTPREMRQVWPYLINRCY